MVTRRRRIGAKEGMEWKLMGIVVKYKKEYQIVKGIVVEEAA